MTGIGHNNPPEEDSPRGWSEDMLAVQDRLIEMVGVYARLPDGEKRFLADLKSNHPSTTPDWMEHLGAADRPIDPTTGRPDKTVPRMRPAYPSSAEISRAMACDSWMGLYVLPKEGEAHERGNMRRRVLRCVLILKARGADTIWPTVKDMLRLRYAQRKRTSPSTLRRDYRDAIADITAGLRRDAIIHEAHKAKKAARRGPLVSEGRVGGKAIQRDSVGNGR